MRLTFKNNIMLALNKKYTAIQLGTNTIDNNVNIQLSFGEIAGPYYNQEYPTEEFNTEQEAVEHAYNYNKYGRWLIIPLISFK